MSVLALIPARGGSKGIPKKNIKYFAGKPLIGWTIEAAQKSVCIDRIVVSTDDSEIKFLATSLGADIPFDRPADLASDESPTILTVLHAIESLPYYEWILVLQPTSPLRSFEDIDGIWNFSLQHSAKSVVSISEVENHPYWMYQRNSKYEIESFIKDKPNILRRQDLPSLYGLNGALYLARTDWLLEKRCLVDAETLGYIMPNERSVDLDSLKDWHLAESLIKQNHEK